MHKRIFRAVYALNYVIQASLTMLCPAGLLILGGWLLHHRCGVGRWVLIAAIVLGVLTGVYSFFHYLLKTMNHIDPTQTKGGTEHDGTN